MNLNSNDMNSQSNKSSKKRQKSQQYVNDIKRTLIIIMIQFVLLYFIFCMIGHSFMINEWREDVKELFFVMVVSCTIVTCLLGTGGGDNNNISPVV